MYNIIMRVHERDIPMPLDFNLGLLEACYRADLYAKKNKDATFIVVNEWGDVDYETSKGILYADA